MANQTEYHEVVIRHEDGSVSCTGVMAYDRRHAVRMCGPYEKNDCVTSTPRSQMTDAQKVWHGLEAPVSAPLPSAPHAHLDY